MIIDRETLSEIALHLKVAADNFLAGAKLLARCQSGNDVLIGEACERFLAANRELITLNEITTALRAANNESLTPPLQ